MCFFWMALSMPSTSACDSFLVDPLMSEKGSTSKTSKNSRPGRMANLLCPGGIHKNGMMYMNVYDIRDQPFDGKTTMARLQIMLNLMTGYGIWPLGEGCSKHGTIYMFFLCHQVTRPSHFVNSPLDHRLWWSHMKSLETLSTFDQQSLPKSHLLFQLDLPQFFSCFSSLFTPSNSANGRDLRPQPLHSLMVITSDWVSFCFISRFFSWENRAPWHSLGWSRSHFKHPRAMSSPGKTHWGMVDHGVCQQKNKFNCTTRAPHLWLDLSSDQTSTTCLAPNSRTAFLNANKCGGVQVLSENWILTPRCWLLFSEKKSSNFGVPLELVLTVYLWVLLTLGLETTIFCRQTSEHCILSSWWFFRSTHTDIYIYIKMIIIVTLE